jgi:hypothetical protein
MSQVRGGFAVHIAGEKLQEVLKAVVETGKPGELTFTIKVKPDKNDDRVVTLHPDVKAKIPQKGFTEGIFFVDEDGKISREDPKQLAMELERKQQGVTTMTQQTEAGLAKVGRGSTD